MTDDTKLKQLIADEVKNQLNGALFTTRKLTDLPTDDYQVTSRKYVNLNGKTTQRPTSSVLGQQFFDTTLGYPVYWSGSTWVQYNGTPA